MHKIIPKFFIFCFRFVSGFLFFLNFLKKLFHVFMAFFFFFSLNFCFLYLFYYFALCRFIQTPSPTELFFFYKICQMYNLQLFPYLTTSYCIHQRYFYYFLYLCSFLVLLVLITFVLLTPIMAKIHNHRPRSVYK